MDIYTVRPKRRSKCKFCDRPIEKGEPAIRYVVMFGKFKKYRIEHRACFIAFLDSLWAKHPPEPVRRKRHVPTDLRPFYERLRAKGRYYRRTGDNLKAAEIFAEAEKLVVYNKEKRSEHQT